MRNLLVVLFFGTLLLSGNLFGQPAHHCTCYEILSTQELLISMRRQSQINDVATTCTDCFEIKTFNANEPLNCNNILSVELFIEFPECMKNVYFQLKWKNPNTGLYESWGDPILCENGSFTLPWQPVLPNGAAIYNQEFLFCPDGCVDCRNNNDDLVMYYRYHIIDENGNPDFCLIRKNTIQFDDFHTLVLDTNPEAEFEIEPTSFTDKIIIYNKNAEEINYQLTDIIGQIVSSNNIFTNKAEINLESLNSGIYFIKILNNNKVIKIKKLIKTN